MSTRSITTKDIALLHQLFANKQLALAPEFQRNAVWPTPAKAYLLDTIINDRPIPLLFFQRSTSAQSGRPTYIVIDGQQRLRTIFDFIDGKFRLIQSSKRSSYYNKRFADLSADLQNKILNYDLIIQELSGYSDNDIRDMFVRMNRYVLKLSRQELRHAKASGPFHNFVEKLGADSFWHTEKIFSRNSIKRMRAIEFAAELAILLIEGPQDKKTSVDVYYAQYRSKFPYSKQITSRLRLYLKWIRRALPELKNSRYRSPVDLYSLVGALDIVSNEGKKLASVQPAQGCSIRGKFRRKHYKKPKSQITDLIGVRIITYYRDQVDPIVRALQDKLEINSKKSVDKRRDLGLRDFGYSSVHLIAKIRPGSTDSAAHRELRTNWFEIQVRSILEHAWAEIEHEVVYKSGIRQPNDVLRRFAALAGSLELLDKEFLALREEREILIEKYSQLFRDKRDWSIAFDVARLLGFLGEYRRRKKWPSLQLDQGDFGPTFESACVESLKAAGLGTPTSLWAILHSRPYRRTLSSFAALKGLAPDQVSPLASIVIAVVIKKPRLISLHFPEILFDPALTEIIAARQRRFTS